MHRYSTLIHDTSNTTAPEEALERVWILLWPHRTSLLVESHYKILQTCFAKAATWCGSIVNAMSVAALASVHLGGTLGCATGRMSPLHTLHFPWPVHSSNVKAKNMSVVKLQTTVTINASCKYTAAKFECSAHLAKAKIPSKYVLSSQTGMGDSIGNGQTYQDTLRPSIDSIV